MAAATLDPGAMRLIEAFLCRLCSQLAALNGTLATRPPEDASEREAVLAECTRLLDASDASAIRAAKIILRQLQTSRAFGADGGTIWSLEQERAALDKRFRQLASSRMLYEQLGGSSGSGGTARTTGAGAGVKAGQSADEGTNGAGDEREEEEAPPLRPLLKLSVGGKVEAMREAGDDEWEPATILSIDGSSATVALLFADRFRAPRVPLSRVRQGPPVGQGKAPVGQRKATRAKEEPPAPSATAAGAAAGAAPLVGQRVRLSGLTAKPQLNGACGLALRFDAEASRYAVKLEADGTRVALRPANLSRVEEAGPEVMKRDEARLVDVTDEAA